MTPQRFVRRPLPLEAIRNTDLAATIAIEKWMRGCMPDSFMVMRSATRLTFGYEEDQFLKQCELGEWTVRDRGEFVPWTDAALRDLAAPEHPRAGFWRDAIGAVPRAQGEPRAEDVIAGMRGAIPVTLPHGSQIEWSSERADAAEADLATEPAEWLAGNRATNPIGSTNG